MSVIELVAAGLRFAVLPALLAGLGVAHLSGRGGAER